MPAGELLTGIMAGARPHPLTSAASQVWPLITATPLFTPAYTVFAAGSTAIGNAPAPTLTVAAAFAQPLVSDALQVLPSITETVPELVSAT